MMAWFWIALISPVLWSASNHIDKFVLGRYYAKTKPGTLMLFTALISLIFSLIILAVDHNVWHTAIWSAALVVAAGVIYFLALFPYIFALMRDETSRVVPLFQIQPIFSYVLALAFLHEQLSTKQLLAALLIIVGAVMINLDLNQNAKFKHQVFWLMMLSSLLFAVEGLLFKFVAIGSAGFWSSAFYQYLGAGLAGLVTYLVIVDYRRGFAEILRQNGSAVISISTFNEIINVGARLCFNYASLLAPLALVVTVNGFQPFFTIAFGVMLTLFWPHLGEEEISRKHLGQKVVSTAIIFAGTAFLL